MSWPETSSFQHSGLAVPAGMSSGALWLGPTSAVQDQGHYQLTHSHKQGNYHLQNWTTRKIPAALPAVGKSWLHVWRIGYRSLQRAHDPVQVNTNLSVIKYYLILKNSNYNLTTENVHKLFFKLLFFGHFLNRLRREMVHNLEVRTPSVCATWI